MTTPRNLCPRFMSRLVGLVLGVRLNVWQSTGLGLRWVTVLGFATVIVCLTMVLWRGIAPTTAFGHIRQGAQELQHEKYSAAATDFSQALKLLPPYDKDNRCACYFGLGTAYLELGAWEQAVENLSQAIAMQPTHADSYWLRAMAYGHLGRARPALEDWKQRLRLVPNDRLALGQIAVSLCDLAKYDDALTYAHRLADMYPNDANSYYTLGYVQFQRGCYDLAMRDFSKAIHLKPDYTDARTAQRECRSRLGRN